MELLITKARSFRQDDIEIDGEIFSDICSRLPNTPRGQFRTKINHKLNFPTEKELEDATTTILKKMWEGNHLLEYFNAVAKTIPVSNLEKILHQYGFAKKGNDFVRFEDFKRHFSDGFGGNKPKKLFFTLATAQQISVLKCLVQFLDFCLKENRPLRYFYADEEKSFNQYIEFANDTLKRSNDTNNEINLLLKEEDRLRLKNYIDRTNEFLKENPERGFPQADFDSEQHISDCLSSERLTHIPSSSFQSTQPRLTIPQAREKNLNYFANAVLDVIGRDEQKARLKAFLECEKNVAWFQLAGVAGQGKSRLAYDLIKVAEGLGFRAGFFTENDIQFFKDQWNDWQPDKPHLLIFDYVIGREEQIKPIFQILISNQDNYRHNIRILLVERQRWDQGSEIKAQHQSDKDSIGLSMHIGDKAPWFLNLCAGDDPQGERLIEPCCFENGVEELKKLDQEDLVTIVKQLSGKELTFSDNALKQTLERIDDTGRPLYAYLLAQQLSESEAGYRSWAKIDLLNYQLVRDKRRWEQAFNGTAPTWGDSHKAMKLAVLATIVRRVNFEDEIIKSTFDEINVSLGREAIAITSSYLINDDNNPHKIHALEPDLLGEWFVLFCFYKRLKFEELLNLSWEYSPNETAIFLQRITQDFIDLSEKYSSWNLIEKLLAYMPSTKNFSQEKYYQALANVAIIISYELSRRNLTTPQNIIAALEHAADLSDISAMDYLGFFYHQGIGIERNFERGVYWYQKAVDKGSSYAMVNLGFCYEKGKGIEQNCAEAVKLFRQAVNLGNSHAMFYLGLCYQLGKGIEENWMEAVKLYRQAADLDDSKAMVNLALCYQYGKGVEENWVEAVKLHRQAADLGNSYAMVNLGLCYQYGIGIQKDWNKAIEKYQLAARIGEISAIAKIQDLLLQNFFGQGNYKIRNTAWTKNKYTHSVVAPAFDPPLLIGDWKHLTMEEVTVCLDKIIISFDILELTDKLEDYIGQYARILPLNFYKDCHLVDLQLHNPSNNDTLVFSAILNAERALLLTGKSDVIHNLNRSLLFLDNPKSTISYLRFFCSSVLGDHGPFQILTNLSEIPFKESINKNIQDKIESSFYSPRFVEGSFERKGWKKIEACVLHGDALFNSVFRVFPDGMISMDEDSTIVDSLPLLQRQFYDIFRTPLQPVVN